MSNTVANIILDNARRIPERAALVEPGGKTWTFGQHAQRVFQLADALRRRGCRRGDRVAILSRNCAEHLEIYGACEVAGFIAAPINHRLTAPEIIEISNNAAPAFLFHASEFANTVAMAQAALTNAPQRVQIGGDSAPAGAAPYEDFIANGAAIPPAEPPPAKAPVYIVHTSGTTGKPRGAVLDQGSQYGTAQAISNAAGIAATDRFLLSQPLFHVGAKFLQLAHHLQGAAIHLRQEFDPAGVWEALRTEGITTLQLVPAMIEMLLADEGAKRRAPSQVKTIFYSTAPIREALLRKALQVFGPVFIQQYGSTEGGAISNLAKRQHQPGGSAEQQRRLLSAGQVDAGVELKILTSAGDPAGVGEAGEILVRHPNLMQGYWNDPQGTAEVLRDGWLAMGDIGYLDQQGFLFIIDRKKDLIISGGENIHPREVERALERHEAVKQCAVIGIPDERWGEAVCACVVLNEGHGAQADQLVEHCRQLIASYKKPKKIVFMEELPRLAMGKVDKPRLRAPYWRGQGRQV